MPSNAETVWQRYDAMEARLTAGLSARMIELAELRPGARVLDVATGRGEPAIAAAQRVAPTGKVVGVDVAADMLAMAAARAARAGVTNLELHAMDAAAIAALGDVRFDAALARWGLMYMARPVAALTAIRSALVPGARLVAAVWCEAERVAYHTWPRRILAKRASVPSGDPEAPGVFYYADATRLDRDLATAGFSVEHSEEPDVTVLEVDTVEELIDWLRAFGMTRLLNTLPEATQRAWEADVRAEAETLRYDGKLRLGGTTRVVVARAH